MHSPCSFSSTPPEPRNRIPLVSVHWTSKKGDNRLSPSPSGKGGWEGDPEEGPEQGS